MADRELVLDAESRVTRRLKGLDQNRRVFAARTDRLVAICEFVTAAAVAAGLDEHAAYEVEIAVEEACTNIIKHAYGGEGCGDIECTCVIADDGLTVILVDRGRPFDPNCVPQPDLVTGLELRKLGGWGLYLMRQLMDEVCFEFSPDAGNVLRMVKRKTTRQSCGICGHTRTRS